LSHGLLWRVGNGQSINILTDRWIPRPITFSVQSPHRILGQQAVVGDLIDQRQGIWKSDLIHEVFMHEEAKIIENIPLSPYLPPDKLIWKETTDGKFTVWSAYHLGKSLTVCSGGQSSFAIKDQGMWKFLWTLWVPNQVKMFTWRACHEILPTPANLFKRKVGENNLCPCCKRDDVNPVKNNETQQ
jgi:hypothetical protein